MNNIQVSKRQADELKGVTTMSELPNKTYQIENCLDKDGNLTGAKKELCEALLKSFQEMKPEELGKYVYCCNSSDENNIIGFGGIFKKSTKAIRYIQYKNSNTDLKERISHEELEM